jgi:hypothetical protein
MSSTAGTEVDSDITGFGYSISSEDAAADYEKDTKKENEPRPARVETRVKANGSGQMRVAGTLTFPCVFRDIPTLSVGCSTIKNPDANTWHDPVGTAGVSLWITNEGYYTGAKIWVRVDIMPIDESNTSMPPNSAETMIYMTFSGRAVKTMKATEVTDEMTPRETDI